MSSFIPYFKRRFLSTWMITVGTAVVGILILLLFRNKDYIESVTTHRDSLIDNISTFGMLLAILLPIIEFASFNSKMNLDMMFSVPISKTKLLMAHYLNGVLTIVLSMTIIFIVWFFCWVQLPNTDLNVRYCLLSYPLTVFGVLITYTFYSFAFLQANTVFDGCVYIVLYSAVFALIAWVLSRLFFIPVTHSQKPVNILDQFAKYGTPLLIPLYMSDILDHFILNQHLRGMEFFINSQLVNIYMLSFFVIISILGLIVMINSFKYRSPVQTGNISNSWFGYKVLIPTCAVCCGVLLNINGVLSLSVILPLIVLSAYSIYRRSLKIKIFDIAMVVVAAVLPHI